MVCEQLWQFSRTFFKDRLDQNVFERDIAPIQACYEDENCLELIFPNRYLKEAFYSEYIGVLKKEIGAKRPEFRSLSLRLVLEEAQDQVVAQSSNTVEEETSPAPDPVLNSLNPNCTFETWVGRCNELGKAAAMQVADSPGKVFNPFVIYGDVGRGKTHLMQAVGHLIQQKFPGQKVAYVHSEQFVSEMIRSLQKNEMERFKERYRQSVLLLDDIQFFVKKVRSQEELFHTINSLLDSGQQIVATCDRFPRDLEGLEDRLKSRFSCGLTVGIDPPELETRVAILLSKARASDILLPEEVAFFIADRIQSNVRELEGALKRLIANASFLSAPITMALARESLKDMIDVRDQTVSVYEVQKALSHYFKLTINDLTGSSRKRSIARPRQLGMFLAKKLSGISVSQIGRDFGNRDHTTVLHACKHIDNILKEDVVLKADCDNLLRILNQ
ncbi:chromosomal replication initiator protein DnaA [Candidatus Comchoanobacter bicostacola]|uniref:Chromosomal replication initiator protein DnaA n=1 Tax=Candidatus Comchoanobacter bicostacola TaxID=2919598 RepID=A0ABY5DLB7_9GAMM|nr:chromosomal replication initiator protein DnaA [Candidatus Comchoanobacter bicostacola]UTC24577.1 chromosomal replication initiator protein DnaA [Candidatus Comchoanobacter bicostacola]